MNIKNELMKKVKILIPDKMFLKIQFKKRMNKKLNLKNPKTFNEKIQWLKLYDRKYEYTNLVDKYEVRKYIEKVLGKDYLIPILGVWENFDEIDFDKLPNKFVLKLTHDSGGVFVVNDKTKLNIEETKDKINKSLKINYYNVWREWPYKNIKPRIICEEMIETDGYKAPIDYKFHCFNGEPDNVMVCLGRESGKPKFYFFNEEWELLKYALTDDSSSGNVTLQKPKMMDEMFKVARILSRNLSFIRVDLYCENEKIYFGELTFYPDSGFDATLLEKTDILLGDKININK